MDFTRFKEIVSAFADDPTAVHFERGNLILQVQGEVLAARLHQRSTGIVVEEDGTEYEAAKWIAQRLAQLDQLAYSVTQMLPPCEGFITAKAKLSDLLEYSNSDLPCEEDDALDAMEMVLGRRLAGMCSVIYLTSDAGEGKTTLINQLATNQAALYRERKTDWLLVPVALGGSPFLRLDNVVAAALLNQLRFRRLYFDAFIQLVRLGVVVLALDGFEEVFVETEGDAASSLGNLISDLKGEGTILVAARTAYFDFKSLDQQARLIDAVRGFDVGFAKLSLDRWGKEEFLSFCEANGVDSGSSLYEELAAKLSPSHPLLTRAVFVRRIVEMASYSESLDFLTQTEDVNDLFHPFIDTILKREIEQKWLDKSSTVAIPLLTVDEHHELLQLIAEEMWLTKRSLLPFQTCESLAEIYCDSTRKTPVVTRQVRERLSSHALLTPEKNRGQLSFDHDHFKEFFLGEVVGLYIMRNSQADLRKLLRVEVLPNFSADIAVSFCISNNLSCSEIITRIQEVAGTEGQASFVRENAGALVARALGRSHENYPTIQVAGLSFPPDSLSNRILENVSFEKCFFQATSLNGDIENVHWTDCQFDHLEIAAHARFRTITFSDCEIRRFSFSKLEGTVSEYFDPRTISGLLINHGAAVSNRGTTVLKSIEDKQDDEEIAFLRKLLTIFSRSLHVGDRVLSLKFGASAGKFTSDTLPLLISKGVIEEVMHRGAGYQRNYRLGKAVSEIASALVASEGSFRKFLEVVAPISPSKP